MTFDEMWQTLGIEPTTDRNTVRRAYARALRHANPEEAPEAFKRLRMAYEWALGQVDAGAPPGGSHAPQATPSPEIEVKKDELNEALFRLDDLVRQSAEAHELITAFQSVLASPQVDLIDRRVQVEEHLARLIIEGAPASDPLADAAEQAFSWNENLHAGTTPEAIVDAVARRDDLMFLEFARKPISSHAEILALLQGPVDDRSWRKRAAFSGLANKVRRFLLLLEFERPSLTSNLDAASVGWWRDYLTRPRFPLSAAVWSAAMAAPLAAIMAAFGLGIPEALIGGLVSFIALLAPALIKSLWVQRGRSLTEIYVYGWPLWFGAGWAPVALLCVLFSALAPPESLSAPVLATVMLFILSWAAVSTPRTPRLEFDTVKRFWGGVVFYSVALVWMMLSLGVSHLTRTLEVGLTALAAVFAFSGRLNTIGESWFELPHLARVAVLAAIAAATIGAAILAPPWHNGGGQALGIALLVTASLASPHISPYLPGTIQTVRILGLTLGGMGLLLFSVTNPVAVIVIGGILLMASALAHSLAGIVIEISHLLSPRRSPDETWEEDLHPPLPPG